VGAEVEERLPWQDTAAEVGAWGAAVTAWVVTFVSEITLARRHGFGALSVVWAVGLDWLAFGAMFLALSYARRGLRTWPVWGVSLGAWGTMVAANVVVALPDLVGAVMHGIIPSLAFALWYALVHGRRWRAGGAGSQRQQRDRERLGSPGQERIPLPVPVPRLPARVEVRRLLKQRGTKVDAGAVSERTGVSIQHARRLLREERQPRLVGEQAPGGPERPSGRETKEVER